MPASLPPTSTRCFRPVLRSNVLLPVGISFYTFTQIAFLVDAYRGKVARYALPHYALFVTYFPHLIAGPILHHKDMIPQFERGESKAAACASHSLRPDHLRHRAVQEDLSRRRHPAACVALAFGPATPSFDQAWIGALAYTFQLYFDFSGYSDMAIGMSLMFGIFLPLNFNSPYKATSIIDFWRRWHMTLSQFLRDYLYIPLGGNRRGRMLRYVNLMVTMVLGGLWHGAAWTFVLWGALHGLYLCINHAWNNYGPAIATALCASGEYRRVRPDVSLGRRRLAFSPSRWWREHPSSTRLFLSWSEIFLMNPIILLIEDDAQIRRFLRASLVTQGYELIEAGTGRDGLALAASRVPEIVLLDLGLPDMEGLDVIKQLRAWSSVPIIVLSARGQERDKVANLDAGADDYLTKPFGIGELLARIRVALRKSLSGRRKPANAFLCFGQGQGGF